MKAKWRIACLTVTIGIGGYALFLRRPEDPIVLSVLPSDVRLVPRSAFNARPWINLPWFGGKRLAYPADPKLPRDLPKPNDIAGYFECGPHPPVWPYVEAGALCYDGVWRTTSGERYHLKPDVTTFDQYVAIPLVYGESPQRMEISYTPGPPHRFFPLRPKPSSYRFKIQLPPNHKPAPRPKTIRVKVGKWTVVFRQRPIIGALFLHEYDVSVEGARSRDCFSIEIYWSAFDESNKLVREESDSDFLIRSGHPVRFSGPSLRRDLTVSLHKWEEHPVSVVARELAGMPHFYKFVGEKGEIIATAQEGYNALLIDDPVGRQYTAIQIGSSWSRSQCAGDEGFRRLNAAPKMPVKPGQHFTAHLYRELESATGEVTLD